MGVSSKVTINGQTFKKGLRLGGKNIVEDLIIGQLTTAMIKGQNKEQWIEAIGGDQVTRLMGFNLSKNVKKAQAQEALAVAKYFQILVANTPMDEEYRYVVTDEIKLKKDIKDKRRELRKELLKLERSTSVNQEKTKREEEVRKKIREIDYDEESFENRERKHKPDNDYVRGDWVLVFRGKRFKAFSTSRDNDADIYFSKEEFEIVDDFNSIVKIAKVIQDNTKDGVIGGGFKVINNNPRAAMLEYGGYDTGDSGPNIGSQYAHGVKNSHTWQAPKGFYRLTNAMWNDIAKDTKTGRYQSYIRKWINADLSNFSVADVDGAEVKKLLKKKTVRTNEIDLNKLTKGKVK